MEKIKEHGKIKIEYVNTRFFLCEDKTMLRIGICDENTKDRTVIRQIVTDTLFREEELSYIEYAEAETLEQEIQASTVPFDLLLM